MLIFTPALYPFHVDMLSELSKFGVTSKIVTQGIFGNYPFEQLLNRVEKLRFATLFGTDVTGIRTFTSVLQFKPNAVVIFGSEGVSGFLFYLAAKIAGALPIVIVEENNITLLKGCLSRFAQKLRIAISRQIYSKAPILIAESHMSAKYVTKLLQVKRDNPIHIRVHGVNTNNFRPLDKSKSQNYLISKYQFSSLIKQKNTVLFVGDLSYHKGADLLIDSIKLLSTEPSFDIMNCAFMLPLKGALLNDKITRTELNQLVNKGSVIPYNSVSPQDALMLYNSADCVVLPSRFLKYTSSDRCPNVALEALACGKILIASAVGGIPTIVGDAAILIEPNSSAILACKLGDVLSHLEKYAAFQTKARERALRYLSIKRYVTFLLDTIRQFSKGVDS